ncbi:MFS transporter [Cohnella phaseoli]|uniref:DHA1 family multidrug resistance protein-like MFS transporter n=1 Tax=Cohnella phaseoli TaxID=456490 RepID=A0A3D9KUN3_9BACL|nr:MFS transporter [Cohnella phaseoli]RED89375.1 DHA1 family multidrug resistance protein-like MFS transporter [Cohnella phaseoli]
MELLLRKRGAILLLMLNIFLIFMGIGLVIPVMPKFMTLLDISGFIVGLLVGAFSLTQLLFSPFAGRLSDSLGRKKIIIAGMLVFALSEWMFGIAHSSVLLFAARFLGGLGAALIMPAVMAYTADMTSNEERAKGMGLINAAITTGFIIGPGIGGYLAEFGIRVPFYAAAIAGLGAAVLTAFILPESLVPAKSAIKEAAPEERESLWSMLRNSYKQPYFLSLILVFVISFGLANYETIFGLFVDHKFGFTPKDIAFILTFGSISGAVVQLTAFGWIMNRFGERNVITFCLLSCGLFILLTIFVSGFWMVFAVTFIVFLSIDILRPAIGTQMSKMAEERQGYVAGLNSAFTSLGNIAGPVIAGFLFDADVNYPYVLAAVVLIISFIMAARAGARATKAAVAR